MDTESATDEQSAVDAATSSDGDDVRDDECGSDDDSDDVDDNDDDDDDDDEQHDNNNDAEEDGQPSDSQSGATPVRSYSIDFLYQYRKHCNSLQVPAGLASALADINAARSTGRRSADSPGGNRGRGGRRGGKSSNHSSRDSLTSSGPTLRTAENKYVPVDPRQLEKDELLARSVRLLLNKLTVEMYESISKQLIEAFRGADSPGVLRALVGEIVTKAMKEPKFNEIYARLCTALTSSCAIFPNGPDGKAVSFRSELLSACQREFESQPVVDDPDGKLSKEEREEQEFKLRMMSLGNSKFIGELYKLGILPAKIMHECIQRLLTNTRSPDQPPLEDSLETLSKLITTIGKKLEESAPTAREQLDGYFATVAALAVDLRITSRIRFMLRDLIDLRNNSWVPRRATEGPSTIAEVHKTAKQQDIEQQLQTQKILREVARPSPAKQQSTDASSPEDGFTPVKGARPSNKSPRVPPSPSRSSSSSSSSLSAGRASPAGGRGAASPSRSPAGRGKQRPPRTPPPVAQRGRGAALFGKTTPNGPRASSKLDDSESPSAPLSSSSSSSPPSSSSTPLSSSSSSSSSSSASPVATMPNDVVEAKVVEVLKEYFVALEVEDSIQNFLDLAAQGATGVQIVSAIAHFYSEGSTSTKSKVEAFWPIIIEAKLFTPSEYTDAFTQLFGEVEDLVCDMPYIAKCVGHLLGTVIAKQTLPLSDLAANPALLALPYPQALFVVAAVLTELIASPVESSIAAFDLQPYLDANDAKSALVQHKFDKLASHLYPN